MNENGQKIAFKVPGICFFSVSFDKLIYFDVIVARIVGIFLSRKIETAE